MVPLSKTKLKDSSRKGLGNGNELEILRGNMEAVQM